MVFGSGAAPLYFSGFSLIFSSSPGAAARGSGRTYPLSRRKPTIIFSSVSGTVWGEYGADLVLVVCSVVFWFGVVRFPGVSAPGSFFFLVFPWKPFHKAKQYVQILKQARCIATEHTGGGPISGAARPILQAAPVGKITFCRESVKVIITCQPPMELRRLEAFDSRRASR